MFYLNNFLTANLQKKKKIRISSNYRLKQNSLQFQNLYPHLNKASIFIFRVSNQPSVELSVPLVTRFSRIAGISFELAHEALKKVIITLVNNFSFNLLYSYIKQLFWLIPVPKHKQLLYLIRALLKEVQKNTQKTTGISITLRGKLAATGNKRKSTFMALMGKGASSRLDLLNSADLRLLRTPTGVIGVVSLITYTR